MAYRGCGFCGGRGCLACEGERQQAIKAAGEPIFVADANNPHDLELLKRVFSAGAFEHAFTVGEGVAEIQREAAIARLLQALHNRRTADQPAPPTDDRASGDQNSDQFDDAAADVG